MQNSDDLNKLDVGALASRCRAETEKYFRKLVNDNRYCFQLFIRAYKEISEEALGHIYAIYLPILCNSAKKHNAFDQSSRAATIFVRTALVNFYLAVHGEKFLQMFSTLPQVIAYINSCISSEIFQDIRKHSRETELGENPFAASNVSDSDVLELLDYVRKLLVDEKDRFLFELRFVLEMKPAEIVKRYSGTWKTTRDVSVHLYHIRQRLRQDSYLRSLVEPDKPNDSDKPNELNESEYSDGPNDSDEQDE